MVVNIGRASPLKRLPHRAMVLVAVLLLPGLALAAQPRGVWTGLVQQANTDVAADATFQGDAVNVHFGEHFSCAVPAKFLKDTGAASVYRFGVSTNGGKFCQDLQGRDVTFTPGADGRLAIDFPSSKTTWHGELKSSPAATPQP
ncbi:MAG TPA: hypothetical protein VM621_14825 [Luteibacter sp.]|uniref:hypothetical protein n=1 Tax=Luteibacter sp. TaxID=1886636 RepID=UPI002C8C752E|nr:hypothetical protein [Luteibacter sp.]HVI56314.1 hypothetical protein [Luteibacter sp.]